MGKYEILYIVHPDLEASIDKITDKVRSVIETRKGKITYEENWGKRKLAYEIRKAEVGIYLLWYFEAPKESLAKIERDLRLTEEIVRYMVLSLPEKTKKVTKEKKTEKPIEEKTAAKKETTTKKTPKVKAEPATPKETEEERMKKLDEKLGAILAEEEDNTKKKTAKKTKEKK